VEVFDTAIAGLLFASLLLTAAWTLSSSGSTVTMTPYVSGVDDPANLAAKRATLAAPEIECLLAERAMNAFHRGTCCRSGVNA
jgi:hypothetical protein